MPMRSEIVQQTDILPTVLGMLHYDKPFVAFGRNIFGGDEPFAFNYLNNTYQAFMGDYLLQFDGQKSIGLYNFKRDPAIVQNLLTGEPSIVLKMERRL